LRDTGRPCIMPRAAWTDLKMMIFRLDGHFSRSHLRCIRGDRNDAKASTTILVPAVSRMFERQVRESFAPTCSV